MHMMPMQRVRWAGPSDCQLAGCSMQTACRETVACRCKNAMLSLRCELGGWCQTGHLWPACCKSYTGCIARVPLQTC